ncbi:MAG TPA: hypothetical protein VGG98_09995 [Solirubrobacteraceae bacterium]
MELAILISILLLGLSLYGGISWRERPERILQTVELHFGNDLTIEAVTAMLSGIAGLRSNTMVSLDVVADARGICHYLHAPQQTLDTLRSQWRGVLPSLRMDEPKDTPPANWRRGVVLRLSGAQPALRTDAVQESAAALLASTQPLAPGERVLIRWYLAAGSHPSLPQSAPRREGRRAEVSLAHLLIHESTLQGAHFRALREKYSGPLLSGAAIVAVTAGHPKRANHLIGRIASVARARGGAYGHVAVRWRGRRWLAWLLTRHSLRRDVYAPLELAGLLPVPIGAPQLPGLTLGTAPALMPSPRIPHTGLVLAVSTWPGLDRPLAQPVIGGLSHTLIAGPTGTGKSSLIGNLNVQVLQAGRGCLLIDGKGDLAQDVLARIPEGRTDDVIVLDPGAGGPLPGLRLFGQGADPELTADLVLGIFADLFRDSWGPLSSRWLRAGLLLLAHDSGATLADLPFVFSDAAFRDRLVARLTDPLARETWRVFATMGEAERAHQLAAPLQKTEELVGRRVIRSVLGQVNAKLDMHDVLRQGKVVIVALSPGKIGSPSARLLGALVVFKFFEAVQARAAVAPERRTPFFAYIDEPAVLGDIPVPLDDLYALARGLGVGVTLGTQSLTQLPSDLRAAVTTNAATAVAFAQNSAADAKLLASELSGVDAEGLQNLGRFECVMRIGLGPGDIAPPVTGRTLPLPPASSDPEAVRRASAARYGADPALVDAALRERHQTHESKLETPVGRLRRDA